jgi:hypothetical protein
MDDMTRQVWRRAKAMTRNEVIVRAIAKEVRFGGIDIILPFASRDPTNYASLYQALQQFREPNTGATLSLPIDSSRTDAYTDAFTIRVPLRTVGTRQFLGRVLLRTITRAQDTSPIPVMIDLDGLTLVCKP